MFKYFIFTALLLIPLSAVAAIKTTGDDLVFKVSGNEVLRIKPSGRMQVKGTIKFKGSATSDAMECNASSEAVIRYDTVRKATVVCNGIRWQKLL